MTVVEELPAVLLVEDDRSLRQEATSFLTSDGFDAQAVADGQAALLLSGGPWQPDVIVVDLLLPVREAYVICRALKAAFAVPVIATTPVIGRFGGGEADDVLLRPFELTQLAEHIRAIVRRDLDGETLSAGDLVLMPRLGRAMLGGRELRLSEDETALLARLMAEPDRPVRKPDLMRVLRGVTRDTDPRIVDVHLVRMMVKIGEGAGVRMCRTPQNDAYVLVVEKTWTTLAATA